MIITDFELLRLFGASFFIIWIWVIRCYFKIRFTSERCASVMEYCYQLLVKGQD